MSNLNFEMIRGDTFILSLEVKKEDGTPENLTGATMKMTCKQNLDDPDLSAIFQVSNTTLEIVFTDPLNGKALITVPPAKTSGLVIVGEQVIAKYDIQLLLASTQKFTILRGGFTIFKDVTLT